MSFCLDLNAPRAPSRLLLSQSESDPDDAEEVRKKVNHSYARPIIQWVRKLSINKGKMDDDEAKRKLLLEPVHLWNQAGFTSCRV